LWDLTRLGDNPVRLSLNLKELSLLKFGPSGDWLAGLDAYGSAQLWNLLDLKAVPVVIGGYGYSESSIQFSPNGRILAFVNGEKQALIYDLQHASDRPVVLQHEGRVISYAFAPGSDRFAAISGENAIYLCNFADRFSRPFILESAQIPISSIVFDPVKPRLVGAGSTGELLIWDLRNLSTPPNIFPGDLQGTLKMVVSANGKWLITSSENGQELWDMTPNAPQRLQLPKSRQNLFFDQEQSSYPPKKHILFSGDSEWLAIQTESQLRVWNLADGQPISSIMPDMAPIKTMIICEGANSLLAATDINDNVHLWTLSDWGIHHRTFRALRGEVANLALSNDGKWLAGGNYSSRVRLWNILEKDKKIDPYRFYSSYSTIDYQGRRLAEDGYGSIEIRDLSQDLENMKVIREYPFKEPLSAVGFSPTGNLLAAGRDNGILRLWNTRMPEPTPLEFKTEGSAVAFLDISGDEKYLVAGFSDNAIWLWDLYNPSAGPEKLTEKSIRASRVKFGPAGRWLAMADGGSQIYLWDMETRQRNPIILGNSENRLKTFAFNPEKSQFATGSWEGQVQIWNLNEISSGPKDLAGQESAVTAMTFSTDGHWLAIGGADGSVRPWNAADPMQFVKLPAHVSRTAAIAFNADSSLLASGNDDGLLRLWDMNDLDAEPIILSGYPGKVEAVFFDPQNRWIYITANNGVQAFWRLSLKRLKDTACRAAGRNLTCEEWRQYLLDEPYRATCPDFPAPQHCN
jgi:WD40 repeat protein